MTMADDGRSLDPGQTPPRPLSTPTFLIIVAGLTLAAAGVGYFCGTLILSSAQEIVRGKGAEATSAPIGAGMQHIKAGNVRALQPIVTNLAGTPPVWIRIEASLVFHESPADADTLVARISEDIVGFLRTVPVSQIEGATGFQHLSEDLNERVRVRSDGLARELIIQGLIIE